MPRAVRSAAFRVTPRMSFHVACQGFGGGALSRKDSELTSTRFGKSYQVLFEGHLPNLQRDRFKGDKT